MSAPSTALSQGELPATHLAVPQTFYQYDGAYSYWGLAKSS